ncbi:MAG: ATP-grasp domain-containing protein [Methanomicrobiaceae archaeon]|nr:ATP-grasp domain-containing protein [Methanomicrobiaceae archaeon]
MRGTVLVAGFATRHVVRSAWNAGYRVSAIDHFCDQDLCWYTDECRTFEELDDLSGVVDEFCRRHPVDLLVVTSGAEDMGSALPICGTPKERVRDFLDKLTIQDFFEREHIPVPPIVPATTFPCMIKPRKGAGGWRNRIVRSPAGERAWTEMWPDVPYIRQQVVDGIPCSVSCIANGSEARAVAVNEQLLRETDDDKAHGFAGAITPFDHPRAAELISIAEHAAGASGCIGSVGVDFMLGDTIRAIEINPRFQATLDTVEMATGRNMFDLHVSACRGILPPACQGRPPAFAARRIVFADRDLTVRDDLRSLSPSIADIPWPGTDIEEGGAVVSTFGWGKTRDDALAMLDKTISRVGRYMSRW